MVALQGASSLKLAHVVGPLPVARHSGHGLVAEPKWGKLRTPAK